MTHYDMYRTYKGWVIVAKDDGSRFTRNLVRIRNGESVWCYDHTYANAYSLRTARQHLANLRTGKINDENTENKEYDMKTIRIYNDTYNYLMARAKKTAEYYGCDPDDIDIAEELCDLISDYETACKTDEENA